jgi:hypothetical protein
MTPSRCPDFLVVGHVTKDLLPHGFNVGGTAAYASITARNLGYRAGVVTSAGPDINLETVLSGVDIVCAPSAVTTTFRNIYCDGTRQQFVCTVATGLTANAVPPEWRRSPVVQLGPLVQEFRENIVEAFPGSLIGVTPQGWMRHWDQRGCVSPIPWEGAQDILPKVDALIFSEEDVGGNLAVVEEYVRLTRIVVVTYGWKGSTVYYKGEVRSFPAPTVREVDPTGAGDVYAAAYLVRLHETDDPWESARFANVVASFSVEGPGTTTIPKRDLVEKWLMGHP